MTGKQSSSTEESKSLRLRKQYFSEAEKLVFSTDQAGFVPMPIITRKLMRHLTPPEFRMLAYLQLRCDRYFICFPTLDEMAHELGTGSRNLAPHIRALETMKFISTASGGGKKFYLVHDPRIAITHLVEAGKISESELFEINELLRELRQEPITAVVKPAKIPTPIRKMA